MMRPSAINRDVLAELRRVSEERITGLLRALVGKTPRDLFFRDGSLVGVRTSAEEERMGRLLIRFGLITPQQLDDAMIFVRHGRSLGETLAELQILERSQIAPMVRRQAMEVACAVVNAPEVTLQVFETPKLFTNLKTPILVADVIMEAVRRVDDVEPIVEGMLSDRRCFQPCTESNVTELRGLTPEDVFVLSRFQGGATLEQVFRSFGTGSRELVCALLGLVESRLVRTEELPTQSPGHDRELGAFIKEVDRMYRILERTDPWSALGMSRDVGTESAKNAFRDALRRYHPDRFLRVNDPELHRKLATLCQKFADAYTCLATTLQMRPRDTAESAIPLVSTSTAQSPSSGCTIERPKVPVPPLGSSGTSSGITTEHASGPNVAAVTPSTRPDGGPAVDAGPRPNDDDPAYDAEVFLDEGKLALNRGDYWRAVQLFQQAVELSGDRAEAHYLLGTAMSKNSRWRREAVRSFEKAIELEPWQRKYYEAVVALYQSAGMIQRSERLLRQADAMGAAVGPESSTECPEVVAG